MLEKDKKPTWVAWDITWSVMKLQKPEKYANKNYILTALKTQLKIFVIGKTVSWLVSISIRHTEQNETDLALHSGRNKNKPKPSSLLKFPKLFFFVPSPIINGAIKWSPLT